MGYHIPFMEKSPRFIPKLNRNNFSTTESEDNYVFPNSTNDAPCIWGWEPLAKFFISKVGRSCHPIFNLPTLFNYIILTQPFKLIISVQLMIVFLQRRLVLQNIPVPSLFSSGSRSVAPTVPMSDIQGTVAANELLTVWSHHCSESFCFPDQLGYTNPQEANSTYHRLFGVWTIVLLRSKTKSFYRSTFRFCF